MPGERTPDGTIGGYSERETLERCHQINEKGSARVGSPCFLHAYCQVEVGKGRNYCAVSSLSARSSRRQPTNLGYVSIEQRGPQLSQVLSPKISPPSSPVCACLSPSRRRQERNAQAGKERKDSQDLRIKPQTGDGNRPDCSGEVIQEPLESAALSLRASRLHCAFQAETAPGCPGE